MGDCTRMCLVFITCIPVNFSFQLLWRLCQQA
jgi:hypothetical protein